MKFWIGAVLGILIICLLADQYLLSQKYDYKDPRPFTGDQLYNPYQGLHLQEPRVYNFHGHTHAWGGITNGKHTVAIATERYQALGYDAQFISQYQWIDTSKAGSIHIPIYEHGFNPKKTHQLVINASKVECKEFLFPQNRSNKQFLINLLSRDTGALVVVNHPGVRNGYTLSDMKYLEGYHLLEAIRPRHDFLQYWDTALTYGHPVMIIGNDDFHNVQKDHEIGNCFTLLFSEVRNVTDILQGLKNGQSAAVRVQNDPTDNVAERARKIDRAKNILFTLQVTMDTIQLRLKEPARVTWISNQGIRKNKTADSIDTFLMSPNDTYVRAEIHTTDNISLYLNPVYRTKTGDPLSIHQQAKEQLIPYRLLRFDYFLWILAVIVSVFLVIKFNTFKRPNRH